MKNVGQNTGSDPLMCWRADRSSIRAMQILLPTGVDVGGYYVNNTTRTA